MYVCMCVCVCIYIYIYIYRQNHYVECIQHAMIYIYTYMHTYIHIQAKTLKAENEAESLRRLHSASNNAQPNSSNFHLNSHRIPYGTLSNPPQTQTPHTRMQNSESGIVHSYGGAHSPQQPYPSSSGRQMMDSDLGTFETSGDVGRDVCLMSMRAHTALHVGQGIQLVERLAMCACSEDRHESVMAMLALACICEQHSAIEHVVSCGPPLLDYSLSLLASNGARTRRYGALLVCNVCRVPLGRQTLCARYALQLSAVLRATGDNDEFVCR
jgi:hypothetical protein